MRFFSCQVTVNHRTGLCVCEYIIKYVFRVALDTQQHLSDRTVISHSNNSISKLVN